MDLHIVRVARAWGGLKFRLPRMFIFSPDRIDYVLSGLPPRRSATSSSRDGLACLVSSTWKLSASVSK